MPFGGHGHRAARRRGRRPSRSARRSSPSTTAPGRRRRRVVDPADGRPVSGRAVAAVARDEGHRGGQDRRHDVDRSHRRPRRLRRQADRGQAPTPQGLRVRRAARSRRHNPDEFVPSSGVAASATRTERGAAAPTAPAAEPDAGRRAGCWPSRRCASWPRTSGVDLDATCTATGEGGVITRDDVAGARRRATTAPRTVSPIGPAAPSRAAEAREEPGTRSRACAR